MKDWCITHFEHCEYCIDIYDSNKPQDEKDRLIDEHTTDSFADYADNIHDMIADEIMLNKLNAK